MKKFYSLKIPLIIVLSILISTQLWADDYPKLKFEINKIKLSIGETRQLPDTLNFIESETSEPIKVNVSWAVVPDSLGTINDSSLFKAEKEGNGLLIATYQTLTLELELETKDDYKNGDDKDDEAPIVKIVPGKVKVELGDSVELYAFYTDSIFGKTDTTFLWSVEPTDLGTFPDPEVPLFQTSSKGEGIIIATLGELSDTIKVEVYESKWKKKKEDKGKGGKKLVVTPGDTIVLADAGIIQYTAVYKTNGNKKNDDEIIWNVSDSSIAAIDSEGLLTLSGSTGLTLVTAMVDNHKVAVELLVIDPSVDPIVNSITVHRVLPNGKALHPKVFKEGESYKIGGLPYPLNVLNSGMLHFPFGCIDEDITIFMRIPEKYVSIPDDSTEVSFSNEIVTGVVFDVQPEGDKEIIHPYWFNIPVELKLVYKRGLLDSLKIAPENLDVFFADTGFISVGEGVATVDSSANRIYASIEHFSTIVVRQSEVNTSNNELIRANGNEVYAYPNPFTKSTTLQFKLNEQSKVDIAVYNLNGQMVKQLVIGEYPQGIHKIKWNGDYQNGTPALPGIYFFKFDKNGEFNQIQKLILDH